MHNQERDEIEEVVADIIECAMRFLKVYRKAGPSARRAVLTRLGVSSIKSFNQAAKAFHLRLVSPKDGESEG